MIINNYNIILRKIEVQDLELLREWRNSDYVKQFMVYQGYITPQDQLNWFKRIDNEQNYYFIINHEGANVGLANIKDIDFKNGTGESGIFMSMPEYTDSDLGVRATLSILDFAFLNLRLEKLFQTITNTNKAAQNFNKHLGVEIYETTIEYSKGVLSKERYFTKTAKTRNFLNQ